MSDTRRVWLMGPVLRCLAIRFVHWEDSRRVLTHVLGNDPNGSTISIWVRCDVNTGACEQAPIQESNGNPGEMDW